MKFELNKDQKKKLEEWQQKIKKKHGEYGLYEYTFIPFGIGTGVKVYSDLEKKSLDLSEPEKW